jgi:chemotaxis protein CheC
MGSQRLSELQRDAITEFLNIGMGQAAASLSEIVNEEVKLSIPTVDLLTCQGVAKSLNQQGEQVLMAAIRERFDGPSWGGEAILLFPQEQGKALVRALIEGDISPEMLAELEEDALMEVGNIVLNACLSSCSDMLSCEIVSGVPIFITAPVTELIGGFFTDCSDDRIMFLQVGFTLDSKNVMGYVALMLETTMSDNFVVNINNYLSAVGFPQVEG